MDTYAGFALHRARGQLPHLQCGGTTLERDLFGFDLHVCYSCLPSQLHQKASRISCTKTTANLGDLTYADESSWQPGLSLERSSQLDGPSRSEESEISLEYRHYPIPLLQLDVMI